MPHFSWSAAEANTEAPGQPGSPPTALTETIAVLEAGAVDRESARRLPSQEIRDLADAGIGKLRVPAAFGGYGLDWVATTRILLAVAAADSNVVQALRAHQAVVEDALWQGDTFSQRWLHRLGEGALAGNAWTEPGAGGLARSGTQLSHGPQGPVVHGEKAYTTGSLFADWLDVTAADDQGRELGVFVRRDQPGVSVRDDWNGFGQRTTASGGITLDGAAVDPAEIRELTDRFPYQTALYQHILIVALAGIAEAAARDAAAEVSARKRVYSHGNGDSSAHDPQILQAVGEIDAAAALARASALSTAQAIEDAAAARELAEEEQHRLAIEAELATARAQVALHRPVLDAVTRIFDALGASAVDRAKQLDRHWRNARTVTSHNPWIYKARILGDYRVNGTEPVRLWSVGTPSSSGAENAVPEKGSPPDSGPAQHDEAVRNSATGGAN
ncbi:MAG TPA: acyl-CoA dehydrogenase family protein [Candidatus Nesterenkonia stercoripullorum]|uniref:Acyl-CoA dehydrogenase family protein n=1 Tax=Candidatus Nesterenkonia stercoripullorum TaxID=2838701 RepID=A0A9D1URU5_9MICC|nr:acyl-CoA dehydrogenase family protein [Candidatus Nesterenkonia stercoripullorum]